MNDDGAFVELLAELKSRNYHFTAVTPATHARVLSRPPKAAQDLRDIFGWNREFALEALDRPLFELLRRAGAVKETGGRFRSRMRVASLGRDLFLHSRFPTSAADSVFFGPDTYRFVRFIEQASPLLARASWLVDMGAGSGAGAIKAARHAPGARMTLIDCNPLAIRLARLNATSAKVQVEAAVGTRIPDGCDIIIANPPYMMDSEHRAYRDGGATFGGETALNWVRQGLKALAGEGAFLLYTGAAIVAGRTPLQEAIAELCAEAGVKMEVEELDPDVFGDELDRRGYEEVERIAVLGITMIKS